MNKPINPCIPECADRSVTCKFDGSCSKHKEYAEKQEAYRNHLYEMKANRLAIGEVKKDRVAACIKRNHMR